MLRHSRPTWVNNAALLLFACLLVTSCLCDDELTSTPLELANEEGVIIGNVPCVSLPGPNGQPFGAYWDNDDDNQHSFKTNDTGCTSNIVQLSFDTITGFDSHRGCPESFVPVDISYSVDSGPWVYMGSLNPDEFRQQHSVSLSLWLPQQYGRVKFRFRSQSDDSGVWSFWNVQATYQHQNESLCQPYSFNALDYFGLQSFPVLNQGGCGSCYAFAAMTVFTYRKMIAGWNIASGGMATPQTIMDCGDRIAWYGETGCGGGYEFSSLDMSREGIGSCTDSCYTGCIPYRCGSGSCTPDTSTCRNHCTTTPGDGPILYGTGAYLVTDIKTELKMRGPVTVFLAIYDSFFTFLGSNPTGVYESCTGSFYGYHVVVIVGWGTDEGGQYWILQNSWGPYFADGGFFRMRIGSTCLAIGRSYGTLSSDEPVTEPTTASTPISSNHTSASACAPVPLDVTSDIVTRITGLMSVFASSPQEAPQIVSATAQIVSGLKIQVTVQGPNNSLITSTYLYGAPEVPSARTRRLRDSVSYEPSLELLSTVVH